MKEEHPDTTENTEQRTNLAPFPEH